MNPALPAFSFLIFLFIASSLSVLQGKTVFKAGEDGYRIYRIPAVVKAANGHLLAFCEARQGGDASEIDLVVKRSEDGGKSWGSLQVVQESSDFVKILGGRTKDITIGNPAPVSICSIPIIREESGCLLPWRTTGSSWFRAMITEPLGRTGAKSPRA